MKTKILSLALVTFFSMPLFAQQMTHNENKTTFGVRGGVNFQTMNGKDANGNKFDYNIKTGFHAGVNAEIPLGTGSYLQPGVLYSQKGAEVNNNNKVKLTYIEIPVNFLYKPVLGAGRMLLGFGPYIGFGLGGKVTSNGIESDVEFTKNFNTAVAKPQYKGIDGGANFLAGYELANNVSFQINAQLGLTQLMPGINGNDNPVKLKNTGFGVSVGYRF
jgi:hypothetical protein